MPTNHVIAGLIALGASYLVGSVPFGYLAAKLVRGVDIRAQGSGNIGATNIARVLGARWGIAVLLLDCCKGLLPVWLIPQAVLSEPCVHLRVACGVATIIGHMFPCWLKFRGGKGVATALGVVLILAPLSTLVSFAAFSITFVAKRIVALSSILAAVAFALSQMVQLWPAPFSTENWSLGLFSLAIPLLIIFRHRSNLGRLLRGEEPRFRAAANDSKPTPSASADQQHNDG